MIKAKPKPNAAYLPAQAAWEYLGISKDMFYAMVRDFQVSGGAIGFGPALRFADHTVRYFKPDLDQCAHRYAEKSS